MPSCLIRTDGSISIGGGHVIRCLAIAEALTKRGWRLRFATTPATLDIAPDLVALYPDSIVDLPGDANDAACLAARNVRDDACVIDGYCFTAADEIALSKIAPVTLAVDDWPSRRHDVDILVDATLGREAAEYEPMTPASTLRLCGSLYAMLRPPFAALRAGRVRALDRRRRLRVLVSFGLTDPLDATGAALDLLAPYNVDIAVVIGDGAPRRDQAARRVAGLGARGRLVGQVDASTMADLIADADLVVGAPGTSSYERCCLGAPSLLLLVADNQRPNADALEAAGAAVVAGDMRALDRSKAASILKSVLSDYALLERLSAAALSICDGEGASRIAMALESRLKLN